jgi:hypothetical protein
MGKNRTIKVILICLLVVTILGMNSMAVAKPNPPGRKFYFIATEGVIDPETNYHHFVDTWTGNGLEQRIITFEWYISHKGNIVSASSKGIKFGGVKADFMVHSIDNEIFLSINIYRGEASETILWQVTNGKDSTNDRFASVVMSIETGELSEAITLFEGDLLTLRLPYSSSYNCRMWLM